MLHINFLEEQEFEEDCDWQVDGKSGGKDTLFDHAQVAVVNCNVSPIVIWMLGGVAKWARCGSIGRV